MLAHVIADLEAEQAALAQLLAALRDDEWDLPTPAPGWAIRDQVAHLAISEDLATLALLDPDQFATHVAEMMADLASVEARHAARARAHTPAELLAWWRGSAAHTVAALRGHDDRDRVMWVTGLMSVVSFTTARLMETWAHGHDIAEGATVEPEPTSRLHHIADLGVRTRAFSFRNRGLDVPDVEPYVALRAPGGKTWTWGDPDAPDRVEGDALDFCLVVTQRRRIDQTHLEVTGDGATAWMAIAQCFAGPPTSRPAT